MNHASISTWSTLIKREWLQHRIGWLTMLLAPAALMLLAVAIADVQLDTKDQESLAKASTQLPSEMLPGVLGVTVGGITLYVVLGVVLLTNFLMAGGLARKDSDDRSGEFWLSMPISHRTSIGATLLAHAAVLPLLGLGVALIAALIAGVVATLRAFGVSGVSQMLTADPSLPLASMALRTLAGLPLALFWLSPLYLTLVAAGAWFKRWGLPLVAGLFFFAQVAAEKLLGSDIVANTLQGLFINALAAVMLVHDVRKDNPLSQFSPAELTSGRIWETFASALQTLASPLAVFALLVSAVMFALLVQWRRRGI